MCSGLKLTLIRTCGMVKLHASPLHDCWFQDPCKKISLGSDKAQVAPGTHCAIFLIKPRLTWRPHRTASPRRSSAAPGVLAPSSECLPETLDALPWEGIANLICKACCQCVIQSVVCLDVMIANLICARHIVVQGVDEACQDNLKFTQLL